MYNVSPFRSNNVNDFYQNINTSYNNNDIITIVIMLITGMNHWQSHDQNISIINDSITIPLKIFVIIIAMAIWIMKVLIG